MAEENLRHRKSYPSRNKLAREPSEDTKTYPEFAIRESILTNLLRESLHIRAIYHIFVVILLVLFFETVIYDLIERGKINIGLSVVAYGFGDIWRGVKLWIFELAIALSFFSGLKLYALIANILKKYSRVFQKLHLIAGVSGVIILQALLILIPTWDLARKHLAVGSSAAVMCEMFRFSMKIHAAAVVCGPRCHNNSQPLPTFMHYLYFLFAPTLIYKDQYPRTKTIRWNVVLWNFMEVAAIILYNSFLWERFILPYWSNYGKETVEAGTVVLGMFACILPGVISFLCGFYCVLHAWLNAFAEILKFGDRLFYEDWWTTSQYSRYFRAWNRVVHSWLRDFIYRPVAPYTGRAFSTFLVFFLSSIAHEMILALSFGFFYPVLLMQFGVFGLVMLPFTANLGQKFPNTFNLLMWLGFFLGNGILWSLYPMEYFARKNCPQLVSDSFFIPKSWSCPEIIMKPNWKFQNPFHLIR